MKLTRRAVWVWCGLPLWMSCSVALDFDELQNEPDEIEDSDDAVER